MACRGRANELVFYPSSCQRAADAGRYAASPVNKSSDTPPRLETGLRFLVRLLLPE